MDEEQNSLWSELRNAFVRGVSVLLPLGLTFWFFQSLLNFMDGILSPLLEQWLGLKIPGLGFVSMMAVIVLVGILTRNLFGRFIVSSFERLLRSIPIVRSVYGAIKDLFGAFSMGSKSKTFRKVVMIEYPRPGLFCIGFMTNEMTFHPHNKPAREFVNVYIPNPPNPTSGFLVLVPTQDVVTLDLSIEEGIKLVLSGGIVLPEKLAEVAQQGN